MRLIDKAVQVSGKAPEEITKKLCPSEMGLEQDQTQYDGSCRMLGMLGSCTACWEREVEK